MTLFRHGGPRTERLFTFLRERARANPRRRADLDLRAQRRFFRKRAVVFTDTSDFTVRTARDGILHCLMLFKRVLGPAAVVVKAEGGELVKMEGDSLLLRFDTVPAACRAVIGIERLLSRTNRRVPRNERLQFSYGIGYGEVLDLEHDVYGLEVNLASKLGEELAQPGEVLLTPAAAAGLEPAQLRRLVLHRFITFERAAIPVQRFRLPR